MSITRDEAVKSAPIAKFMMPQYHNGLLLAEERLNERRIKMALVAFGDGPTSLVKQPIEELEELLRASQTRLDEMKTPSDDRTREYQRHEEIESILELIRNREAYADKLEAYMTQTAKPRSGFGDEMPIETRRVSRD